MATPVFFHPAQLDFRPRYEWALGKRIDHPERTERADQILSTLEANPKRFDVHPPEEQPLRAVAQQHAQSMLRLYESATELEAGVDFNPSVFLRRVDLPPNPDNLHHAGFFCFDSGTPLNRETKEAALWSAACATSAARAVNDGHRLAYALSRPPGHHAEYDRFGGYCYINNAALAAKELRRRGRVAVVDVDVHHGNGTQALFWRDGEVLTLSIHNEPEGSFPFFTGRAHEVGEGDGRETNVNVPLPDGTDGDAYAEAWRRRARPCLRGFDPDAIVLAAGVDGYVDDPIGHFDLTTEDFRRIGALVGKIGVPVCAVQEGGYYTPAIGDNVLALLKGLEEGLEAA